MVISWFAWLSIPFWSDFIFTIIALPLGAISIFQSHFGLILSGVRGSSFFPRESLSIPFWSDFIVHTVSDKPGPVDYFQSHFGLILSLFTIVNANFRLYFQSHFGLILSVPEPIRSGNNILFQSHFGLILSIIDLSASTWYGSSFNPILV